MKKYPFAWLLAGFLGSCAQTDSQPGSGLAIESQDTSAIVPGNAPIADRMGMEGTQHYHRKVVTQGLTPLGGAE